MPGHELLPVCEFKEFLGHPVLVDGAQGGALVALRTSRRLFTPKDEQLIAFCAKALAVQEAWLTRERSLLKRVALEKRIEEISTLAIAVDDTAAFLERCLGLIGVSLKVGGACWWEFDPKAQTVSNTAEWLGGSRISQIESLQGLPLESMPWAAGRLMEGQVLPIEDTNGLPEGRERETCLSLGIHAALVIPLFSRETFFGFMGVQDYEGPKRWAPEEISILQTAAEIMLRGIENKKLTDELAAHRLELQQLVDEKTLALRRSNERLTLEVKAHQRTIEKLRAREVELGNRNKAFEGLSDQLSKLIKRKGDALADIEAGIAAGRVRLQRATAGHNQPPLSPEQIRSIRSGLEEVASRFKSERFGAYALFTPAEIKIAEFVKLGLSSKEISRLIDISDRTVQVHCLKIRDKLGIKNKKVNLRVYLMSL
jgi:DNA-binding CsgD family transcriptional regulator/GAF domain-containing protein